MKLFPSVQRGMIPAALFFAAALSAPAQTIQTDVPRTISYQGLLAYSDGTPVPDGEHQITITLYADPGGRRAIWSDSYTTQVSGGLFNIYLGEGKKLPDPATMNAPLWIGTGLNGADEMRPLTPLSAVPYALNVPDRAITTDKLADGAVTAEKIAIDYVGELQVEGQKVSAKGTALNLVGTPSVPLTYDEATQSLTIGKLPAQTGDREKGTSAQALPEEVWSTAGDGWNAATSTAYTPVVGDWIGTSAASGIDFIVQVNSTQVMNYQVSGVGVPNMVGGDISNTISAGSVQGSIIAEGTANTINIGDYNAISGGENNTVAPGGASVSWGVIAGGQNNSIDADHAAIGGGQDNSIRSMLSVIGGGQNNSISGGVFLATIGGGGGNSVTAPEATIAGGHRNQVHSYVSAVGGGHDNYIWRFTEYSTIGGGILNSIGDAGGVPVATHSTIGGGESNRIGVAGGSPISHATIGGGQENLITTPHSMIGGGRNNQIYSDVAAISGGQDNVVADNSPYAFIGGGQNNITNAGYTTIGGGQSNNVTALHSTIGGGQGSTVSGVESVVGGGLNNRITSRWGTIAGGANNGVTGDMGTVGGGENNQVTAPEATIAGGHRNQVHAYVSVVGGGHNNFIWRNSTYSAISGGLLNNLGNSVSSPAVTHSFIGGGESNAVGSTGPGTVTHSAVGGGQNNVISTATGGAITHSFIGGGQNNTVQSSTGTIGGGLSNTITAGIQMGTIGGGGQNTVRAAEATIAGGHRNTVESYVSTIAGGHDNLITRNSEAGFIGGGRGNTVDAPLAVIGGGQENQANGTHTTIPGGDRLTTNRSYAQSAMGFYNAPRGSMGFRPNSGTIAASNDPLFMVGNGDINAGTPSNAFEVSYNGHSTVYGTNGSGGGNAAIEGATYVDNIIYAWGDIAAGGGINSDFGVASVAGGGGVYDITISITDPLGNPITINNASITATIVDSPDGENACSMITTTQMGAIGANSFRIRTYRLTADGGCREADLPFMFKVTGRQ